MGTIGGRASWSSAPAAPRLVPERCGVCGEVLAEGVVCRAVFNLVTGELLMYGHAACVDGWMPDA